MSDEQRIIELVRKQLLTIGISESDINNMISNDRLKRSFIRAFTHQSSDSDDNYELDEQYGDALIKAATVKFVHERFPTWPLDKRTRLISALISKSQLSQIGKSLGFMNLIQSNEPIVKDTLEDVFESFISVLARVTESYFNTEGIEYVIVSRYLRKLYSTLSIDFEKLSNRDWKTLLKEDVFDVLGWKDKELQKRGLNSTLWRKIPLCVDKNTRKMTAQPRPRNTCYTYTLEIIVDPFGKIITWAVTRDANITTKYANESAFKYFESKLITKQAIIETFGQAAERQESQYVITPDDLIARGFDYSYPVHKDMSVDDKLKHIANHVVNEYNNGRHIITEVPYIHSQPSFAEW